MHASLLPKYRGAGPIQWALINGDKTTGVTIFQISSKVDTGEILDKVEVKIEEDDNMFFWVQIMLNRADLRKMF